MDGSDPRPGFQEVEQPSTRWWAVDWWIPGSVLVVMVVICLSFPALRAGLLWRTEQVNALVVAVRTDQGCDSDPRTLHDMRWSDGDGVHTAELRTCGPVSYEVGDRVDVWVAPGVHEARRESPGKLWLGLILLPPLAAIPLTWMWNWRTNFLVNSQVRSEERRRRRRARRTG